VTQELDKEQKKKSKMTRKRVLMSQEAMEETNRKRQWNCISWGICGALQPAGWLSR